MFGLLLRAALFSVLVLAAWNESVIASMFFGEGSENGKALFSQILRSLVWLSGALVIIALLERFLWNGVVAKIARHPVPGLLKTTVALIIMIIAVACVVSFVFGRDVTAIWATSGVVGLVLGFALRSMIQDVFTGIALNLDGSIREGDWISLHHRDFLQEQYGKVLDIGWRVSRVQREDNNVVVVPNGLLGTMAVTNFAHAEHVTRLQVEVVIDFDVPSERVQRILLAGAKGAAVEKGILSEPEPSVIAGDPKDHGVCYVVRFWGKVDESSPSALKDAVMTQLLRQLRIAGLTPALPKEDVFIDRRPKRLLNHVDGDDRTKILGRTELFSRALNHQEIAELAKHATAHQFLPEDVLVSQGDDGNSLFVVAEGILDVHVNGPAEEPLKVGHILPGDIFGEMSLLTGAARSATVTASTGVVAYEVTRAHFKPVLDARPEMAHELSRLVAARQAVNANAAVPEMPDEIDVREQQLSKRILEGMAKVFSGRFVPVVGPSGP